MNLCKFYDFLPTGCFFCSSHRASYILIEKLPQLIFFVFGSKAMHLLKMPVCEVWGLVVGDKFARQYCKSCENASSAAAMMLIEGVELRLEIGQGHFDADLRGAQQILSQRLGKSNLAF